MQEKMSQMDADVAQISSLKKKLRHLHEKVGSLFNSDDGIKITDDPVGSLPVGDLLTPSETYDVIACIFKCSEPESFTRCEQTFLTVYVDYFVPSPRTLTAPCWTVVVVYENSYAKKFCWTGGTAGGG